MCPVSLWWERWATTAHIRPTGPTRRPTGPSPSRYAPISRQRYRYRASRVDATRRAQALSLRRGSLLDHLGQLPRLVHLDEQVAPAHKLALDVALWDGGPVRVPGTTRRQVGVGWLLAHKPSAAPHVLTPSRTALSARTSNVSYSTLYELRICTAVLENPHCGKSFEPFMKRKILLPSTIALIRSSVVSMSRGGDAMRGRGAADAGRASVTGSSASAEARRKKAGSIGTAHTASSGQRGKWGQSANKLFKASRL